MPVIYAIDKNVGLIRTRCIGDVTFFQVLDHFRVLAQDADRPANLDVLLDLSELTSLPNADQLRTVAAELGPLQEAVRFGACAIIAPQDVVFGLARMFEAYTTDRFRVTRVFRTSAEAEAWLGSGPSPS